MILFGWGKSDPGVFPRLEWGVVETKRVSPKGWIGNVLSDEGNQAWSKQAWWVMHCWWCAPSMWDFNLGIILGQTRNQNTDGIHTTRKTAVRSSSNHIRAWRPERIRRTSSLNRGSPSTSSSSRPLLQFPSHPYHTLRTIQVFC